MSPLTCSLLAFLALFAAADALLPNPYCSKLVLGKQTKDFIDFSLTAPGGVVTIPDKCSRPGRRLVGELISVCNVPNSKPTITQAIQSQYDIKPNFAMVNIDCPSNIAGCDKLDVHVTEYCEMVTAPH
ncbi:uncharacterized protein LOC133533795 [Cydia pomonella]|uniref:uncharacterized protein LOC133533795 n=1 Tax=Cydia pomonella TaxID=82600 RepID=UPI002ADE5DCE|nr:uncharacterized protein LOC133533795 [Cydia pomonella]